MKKLQNDPSVLLLLTMMCTLVSGCTCAIDAKQEIALRDAQRTLVLHNATGGPLDLLPAPDAVGGSIKTIPDGAEVKINFELAQVVRAGLLVRSDKGWFYDKGNQASVRLTTADASRYLDMAGPDAMFRVKRASGEVWEFRVELGDCLFAQPPAQGYTVKIDGPPDPVGPVRLCR